MEMRERHVASYVCDVQSHRVAGVGAVKKPGVFQIRGTKTILEPLSRAEGLADDAGDTVLVMRGAGIPGSSGRDNAEQETQKGETVSQSTRGEALASGPARVPGREAAGEIVEVNLKSLLESLDPAFNIPVHPPDILKATRPRILNFVGYARKPVGF